MFPWDKNQLVRGVNKWKVKYLNYRRSRPNKNWIYLLIFFVYYYCYCLGVEASEEFESPVSPAVQTLRDSLFGTTPTDDDAVALRVSRLRALGRLTPEQRSVITPQELIQAGFTPFEVRLILTQVLRREEEEEGMELAFSQLGGRQREDENGGRVTRQRIG